METSDVGHMVHLSRVKWSPSLRGGKSLNNGFLLVIELRCFPCILVILVVFPSSFLREISGGIPRDPEELSRWLRRETNLRVNTCRLLRGE